MGADYLWACAPLDEDGCEDLDVAKLVARWRARLAGLDDETLAGLYLAVFGCGDDAASVRGAFESALDVVVESRRDVSIDKLGLVTFIHSGGMSWGDSPTESFDDVVLLAELLFHFQETD